MTNIEALATSVTELDGKISALVVKHNRAMDTLGGIHELIKCNIDSGLTIRSIAVLLDLYDRPMEQPEPEDDTLRCESCNTPITREDMRYEEGGGKSEPRWTDYGCRYCLKGRNVKPLPQQGEPQSQAERDGDA